MHSATIGAVMFVVIGIPAVSSAQQPPAPSNQTYTLSGEMQRGYHNVQRNLTESAEKMPDEHYGFKPTPEIKPFGQLVAHAALSQFRTCALLKDEPNPKKDEKEDATRTKADTIALLKASTAYCDPLVAAVTDASAAELTKIGSDNRAAKGLLPPALISHGEEMYGIMTVYLRLKGIVPPTTEREAQMKQGSK
jgi:hypothetical protein